MSRREEKMSSSFLDPLKNQVICNKKLSSTCEEYKFRGWYDAAFRLGQETHQILFEFQQTR